MISRSQGSSTLLLANILLSTALRVSHGYRTGCRIFARQLSAQLQFMNPFVKSKAWNATQSEWEFKKEYHSNTTSPTFTNSGWVINILLPSVLFSLLLLLSHTILRDMGLWEGDCGTRKSDLLCRRHYESSTFSVFPAGVWPRGPRSASQHSHITNWANRG